MKKRNPTKQTFINYTIVKIGMHNFLFYIMGFPFLFLFIKSTPLLLFLPFPEILYCDNQHGKPGAREATLCPCNMYYFMQDFISTDLHGNVTVRLWWVKQYLCLCLSFLCFFFCANISLLHCSLPCPLATIPYPRIRGSVEVA